VVIATPNDIETLRKVDKQQAQQWRTEQRTLFLDAVQGGYHVRGLNADSSYVLSKGMR